MVLNINNIPRFFNAIENENIRKTNGELLFKKCGEDEETTIQTQNSFVGTVLEETTFEREIRPLKKIMDNYPKYILSMDEFPLGEDGINQVNIIDFLLEGES